MGQRPYNRFPTHPWKMLVDDAFHDLWILCANGIQLAPCASLTTPGFLDTRFSSEYPRIVVGLAAR
jgi:hypothetical protein